MFSQKEESVQFYWRTIFSTNSCQVIKEKTLKMHVVKNLNIK